MKQKHILWGMLALFAANCTNDEMNEVAEMKQNGIQVTADFGTDTRIDFSEEGNVTHVFWNEGDQITIYDEAQGGLDYQVALVSNGGATANFSAIDGGLQETAEGATVNAIYPALPVEDGIVKLPNTNVWNEDRLIPYATASGSISDSKLGLSFFHEFAYLKLTLNAETVANSNAQTIHAVYLTTTQDPAPLSSVNGTYDIINNSVSYQDAEGANSIHFSLNEPFTATGDAEKVIYIPILPQSAGETLTLSILHHDDYGVCDTLLTVSKQVPESGFTYGNVYTYTPKYKQSFTKDENNTITVFEPGVLSQAITEEEKYAIKELKIIGPLNGDDIRLIREMAGVDVDGNATEGVLTNLDISEATIVEGGDYYYFSNGPVVPAIFRCYTSNDIVGDYMFDSTILQQVLLPESVTSIGERAFWDCSLLFSIDIPDGVTSIGKEAFRDCSSLVSVKIPDGVTEISESAFWDCSSLTSITLGSGLTSIGDYAFYSCSLLENVTISSQSALTSIGRSAFEACTSLETINIPNSVTQMGTSAFYGCIALSSAVIGSGLSTIDINTFSGCSSLTNLTIGENVVSIGESAFYNCTSLIDVALPETLTTINVTAFQGCTSLTTITIPDAVTTLGRSAFYGCTALKKAVIGDGVTTIVNGAFYGCISLEEVLFGNRVTTINQGAFEDCTSLSSISLPKTINKIDAYAFQGCTSLNEVTCSATTPPTLGSDAFTNIASPATLYVPVSTYDTYMASDWANYFTTIDGGSYANGIVTLTTAGDLPYLISESEKYSISSLKVIGPINGTDIRFIREMAGVGVEGWSTTSGQLVDLDMSEAMIVEGGDYYLDHFTAEMAMGPLYTSSNEIGEYMFGWVEGNSTILEKVLLPNTVTCIGGGAFEACRNLTSINIPNSVKTIRWLAFNGCSNIETITIPSSVVNIENHVFWRCSILSEVTCLATTPPTLDDGVFDGISSTATLIVPAGSATAYSASDWAQYFTTIEEM